MNIAGIGLVIDALVRILLIVRIDFAAPVVTIQRYLAYLRHWQIRSFKWGWMIIWALLPAMLIAGVKAVSGVDLWASWPAYVTWTAVASAVGMLASSLFDRWARRRNYICGVYVGYSVRAAQAALDEVHQFARNWCVSENQPGWSLSNIPLPRCSWLAESPLAEHYSFTAISGYLRYSGAFSSEIGDSPYPTQALRDTWSERQFTEEIRLNGTSFGLLDWTVGGYYFDEGALFGGVKLLSPGLPAESLFTGNDPITSKSKSGFAHGVFHVTDALRMIGGVRYTSESKDYTFQRLNPYDVAVPSYTPVGPLNNTTGSYSGSHTDYRAGLQYQWSPEVMTYAQYSTGYRGGGVNPRPFIPQQEVPFRPETLGTTEIGMKSHLFDRTLLLNFAGFYSKYKDMLFTNSSPTIDNGVVLSALNLTPVNVGSANIKGAELEFQWRPVAGLEFNGSASYLNFKLTSISQSAATTVAGVTLDTKEPYAPSQMYSLGAQYTVAVGSLGSLIPRLDAQYQSSFFTDITDTRLGEVSGRTLMNAHLTWRSPKDDWDGNIAVTNLTDKFYYINKVNSVAPTFVAQGQPGAPREWLVTVRRNF